MEGHVEGGECLLKSSVRMGLLCNVEDNDKPAGHESDRGVQEDIYH